MSLYSDWKFGVITDAEYSVGCRKEEALDNDKTPDTEEDFESEDFFEDDELDEF